MLAKLVRLGRDAEVRYTASLFLTLFYISFIYTV